MHNASLLLQALNRIFGQVRSLAPVLKLSMAYPLRSLFKTGVTLAMFTLVVFTLVVGTVVSVSFMHAWDDTDTFGGGFDVRAVAAPSTPVREPEVHVPRAAPSVRVIAAQSVVPLEATQAGHGRSRRTSCRTRRRLPRAHDLRPVGMANGYRTEAEVWRALRTRPNLAVVDAFVAPRRDELRPGGLARLQALGLRRRGRPRCAVPSTSVTRKPGRRFGSPSSACSGRDPGRNGGHLDLSADAERDARPPGAAHRLRLALP